MNLTIFLIASLATFRLSLLISKEDGPAWIFLKLRRWLKREAQQHQSVKETALHEGIECQWCVSVWTGAIVTLYLVALNFCDWPIAPLIWLALSGTAIIINQTFTKG